MSVGRAGNGTLLIEDGGVVTSAESASIASLSTSTSTATVTGSGSEWIVNDSLVIGSSGDGTLKISDSGLVTIGNATTLGSDADSNGTLWVTGTGSKLASTGVLTIGSSGTGTLRVSDGGIVTASSATIGANGTLNGNGTVTLNSGAGTLTNNGTVAPGNSIGTLTVEGDFTFENGSTFEVEVNNAGQTDLLAVSGDVAINSGSTLALISEDTITGSQSYVMLTASSITGTFDTVNTALLDLASSIDPADDLSLDYGSTQLTLTITALAFNDASLVQTPNQAALGVALQQASEAGNSLNSITSALQSITTTEELLDAYDDLSGQTTLSLTAVAANATTKFINTVSGRLQSVQSVTGLFGDDRCLAKADSDNGAISDIAVGNGTNFYSDSDYGFWMKGFGVVGDRETEEGVNGYDYRTWGMGMGVDYQVSETLMAGVTIGYSNSDIDYAASVDDSQVETLYTGLYGSLQSPTGYVDAILTYADLEYETDRYIDLLDENLSGDFDGYQLSGYLEVGRHCFYDDLLIQPLVGFEMGYQKQDAYTEKGGDSALHFDAKSSESYKLSVGAKVSKYLLREMDESLWMQVRAKWLHEFGDATTSVSGQFASTPSQSFLIEDAAINRDSAVIGTGLIYVPKKNVELFMDYDALLNRDTTAHVFSGGVKLLF